MNDNATNEIVDTRADQRGTKRCFADAWKTIVFYRRNYLRGMALYSLLAGIGLTLFIYMCGMVARETLLPMHLLVSSGEEVAQVWDFYAPTMVEWVVPLAAGVLWWVACVLWRAAVMSQTEHYATNGEWPSGAVKLRRDIFGKWRRLLLFDAMSFVITVLLSAGVLLLLLKASWWSVVPALLLALFLLWTVVARYHFAYHRTSVPKAYVAVVKTEARRLSSVLMLLLITGAVMMPLTLMFAMPYVIPECNATYNEMGVIMGDAPALPGYFHWAYPLIGILVGSFYYVVRSWQLQVLSLRFLPCSKQQ